MAKKRHAKQKKKKKGERNQNSTSNRYFNPKLEEKRYMDRKNWKIQLSVAISTPNWHENITWTEKTQKFNFQSQFQPQIGGENAKT